MGYSTMEAIATSLTAFSGVSTKMARPSALGIAALAGLVLAGCGGMFGQSGISVPHSVDGVQTVSDAADSLIAHRTSATDNATTAIAVTDALGSVVRDLNENERFLGRFQGPERQGADALMRDGFARTASRLSSPGAQRVFSISQLIMRPGIGNVSAYCQSSAGYSLKGIPSLDETFGWQNGTYSGGTRMTDGGRHFATWSATASGEAVQAPVGALSVVRSDNTGCPMMAPTFEIKGASSANAFSIPLTLTYRHGALWNLSVNDASFAQGEILDAATSPDRHPVINGIITKRGVELAAFRSDTRGDGTLTITSTGAQYVIAGWIVVGT